MTSQPINKKYYRADMASSLPDFLTQLSHPSQSLTRAAGGDQSGWRRRRHDGGGGAAASMAGEAPPPLLGKRCGSDE
uniref:Uncharacterized protein n=1 Tax=Leersia perrieri TaxID=77586 RepID=A0A0D9VWK3_9ORYZ